MRTGVLSDEYIRKHSPELFPLSARMSDNIYGQSHKSTGRKHQPRRIFRARAPYMDHHEFAKMMNPLNTKEVVEAFGDKLRQVNLEPMTTMQGQLETYNAKYPRYKGVLPEVAKFILETGVDPFDIGFTGANQYGIHPHRGRIRSATLKSVHDKILHELRGKGDSQRIAEVNRIFQETLEELLTPQQKFKDQQTNTESFTDRSSILFGPGWQVREAPKLEDINDPD